MQNNIYYSVRSRWTKQQHVLEFKHDCDKKELSQYKTKNQFYKIVCVSTLLCNAEIYPKTLEGFLLIILLLLQQALKLYNDTFGLLNNSLSFITILLYLHSLSYFHHFYIIQYIILPSSFQSVTSSIRNRFPFVDTPDNSLPCIYLFYLYDHLIVMIVYDIIAIFSIKLFNLNEA